MDDLPTEPDTNKTADETGNPPLPVRPNSGPAADPEPQGQSGKSKYSRKLHKAPVWIEAACAVALVGITGFYTHYAKQQRDAILSGNWNVEKSANAAKEAADATTTASNTAIQTMHIDERAWINILAGKSVMVDNSPLVIPIAVINQGKTTALNVTGKMFVNLLPVKDEPDFVYKHGHPAYQLGLKALLPNRPSEEAPYAVLPKYANPKRPVKPIIVTPTLRKEIAAGQLYIVVYLRLDYDDIFGVHHWLQFCAHGENGIPGVNAQNAGSTCGDYNDVDRNF